MKEKSKRVIPGLGLSLGVTITMLSVIVIIPLASLAVFTGRLSFGEFIDVITNKRVLASFEVSFVTAFIASLINAVWAWCLRGYL